MELYVHICFCAVQICDIILIRIPVSDSFDKILLYRFATDIILILSLIVSLKFSFPLSVANLLYRFAIDSLSHIIIDNDFDNV